MKPRAAPFLRRTKPWRLSLVPWVMATAIGILGSGCAAVVKAGREPADPEVLRHANFWNLYRRGIARMQEKRWEEAARDMESCLGLRAGAKFAYPFDRWRVRTYGLHVTEHYFPHRELGVCRLESGDPASALDSLLESHRQEPSSRARYYINLARARLIKDSPLPPPRVEAGEEGTIHSRSSRVTVQGIARGEAYVSSVRVGGREQFVELAGQTVAYRQTLDLAPGSHDVLVEAADLKGQVTRRMLRVVVDPVSPQFQFSLARREGGGWRLTGACADAFGLRHVSLDGHSVIAAPGPETRLVPLDLTLADGQDARLSATDWAGNVLEARVREDILPRLLARRGETLGHAAWAAAGEPPPPGASHNPETPPVLSLDGLHDLNVTYEDQFFVSGAVDDRVAVTGVHVQGGQVLETTRVKNNLTRFGCFVPVAPGTNEVVLVATAEGGRRVEARVKVERREPAFAQPSLRLAVTLPPLVGAGRLPDWFRVQSEILHSLVNRPAPFEPRFQVLARGDDLLAVLRELRLNLSDLVDDRARIPYRKLASSDLFLNGEVLPDPGGVTIRVHTISTEDGTWLGSDDVYLPHTGSVPSVLLHGLAAKVERRFPVVNGQIGAAGTGTLRLPLGSAGGLAPGARLLVVRPGPDGSFRSGRLLRDGEAPVQLLVLKVGLDHAIARPVKGIRAEPVAREDWFYSR